MSLAGNGFDTYDAAGRLFKIYGLISSDGINPENPSRSFISADELNDPAFRWLENMATSAAESGLDGIILTPSFQTPHDSSLCYQPSFERTPFNRNLINRVLDVRTSAMSVNPSIRFYYCPPLFNNQLIDLHHYHYYPDVQLGDVSMLWSGYSFFGTQTDVADLQRSMSVMGSNAPVFLDNSLITATAWGHYKGTWPYYPSKLKLFNIFEPFGNMAVKDVYHLMSKTDVFINQPANSEINLIRIATAADFYWNMNQYDPDRSLWCVLVNRYGEEAARSLINYSGLHAEMLEIILRLNNNEQMARNARNGNLKMQELINQTQTIAAALGNNHILVEELSSLNTFIQDQLDQYQMNIPLNE